MCKNEPKNPHSGTSRLSAIINIVAKKDPSIWDKVNACINRGEIIHAKVCSVQKGKKRKVSRYMVFSISKTGPKKLKKVIGFSEPIIKGEIKK